MKKKKKKSRILMIMLIKILKLWKMAGDVSHPSRFAFLEFGKYIYI